MNNNVTILQNEEKQTSDTLGKGKLNRASKSAARIGMTIEELAEYTGIGRTTLRQLVNWGKIPTLKIGRKTIIRVEQMENFMEINEGLNLLDKEQVRSVR